MRRNEVYISKAIIRFVNKLTFTSKQHSSIHPSMVYFQLIDTVIVNHKRSNFKLMEFNKSSEYKIHYQHFCLQNFLNRSEFFLSRLDFARFFFVFTLLLNNKTLDNLFPVNIVIVFVFYSFGY